MGVYSSSSHIQLSEAFRQNPFLAVAQQNANCNPPRDPQVYGSKKSLPDTAREKLAKQNPGIIASERGSRPSGIWVEPMPLSVRKSNSNSTPYIGSPMDEAWALAHSGSQKSLPKAPVNNWPIDQAMGNNSMGYVGNKAKFTKNFDIN